MPVDQDLNKRIPELDELGGAVDQDLLVIYQAGTGITKKILVSNILPASSDDNFEWFSTVTYSLNDVVTYNGLWWSSLTNGNSNNIPTEGANWTQVNKPTVVRVPPWVAGIYSAAYSFVIDSNSIYYLKPESDGGPALPFNSSTAPKADSTNWQLIGEKILEIDIQESRFIYDENEGTANALTANLSPAVSALNEGLRVYVKADADNTGATTLNVNGLGAVAVVTRELEPLSGGEIINGSISEFFYDGTQFQLMNSGGGGGVSTFEKDFTVDPDLDTVIEDYKVTTPVQLTVKLFDGVTTLNYRTKLDDGVDTFTDRADLTALNTFLSTLGSEIDVVIEVTTNATKLTVVRFIEDRS